MLFAIDFYLLLSLLLLCCVCDMCMWEQESVSFRVWCGGQNTTSQSLFFVSILHPGNWTQVPSLVQQVLSCLICLRQYLFAKIETMHKRLKIRLKKNVMNASWPWWCIPDLYPRTWETSLITPRKPHTYQTGKSMNEFINSYNELNKLVLETINRKPRSPQTDLWKNLCSLFGSKYTLAGYSH